MLSSVQSALPLSDAPVARHGVMISAAPSMARYSLRARDPAVLSAAIGRDLPRAIGESAGGITRLGPDEYYALLPAGETLSAAEGQAVSIAEVSSRAVGIIVEGLGAAERIMSGCPLDLERMAPGRATRTVYETVEIVLLRVSETRFHIDVWRSFAPWLWEALLDAGHE